MSQTVRTALGLAVLLGTSPFAWPLQVTQPPTLVMNPNGLTPLAGVLRLETDVPTRVTLRVFEGNTKWIVALPELETEHELPVLGLKAGRTYGIDVMVTDRDGNPDATLTADDFEVEEDGVAQKVEACKLVAANGQPPPGDTVSGS